MNSHRTSMNLLGKPRLRQARRLHRRAFTLIELLVVITIIGILAALTMPALAQAKNKARNAACVSQLRQLGLAVRMYADDHENRLPAAELLPSLPVSSNAPLPRICDALRSYAGGSPGSTNALPVFHCPSDKFHRFKTEGSSYEWNADLNGRRIDETRSVVLRIVLFENVPGQEPKHTDEQKELTFPPEITPLLLDYEDYHPRGSQSGKNVVFLDGHVTPLRIP